MGLCNLPEGREFPHFLICQERGILHVFPDFDGPGAILSGGDDLVPLVRDEAVDNLLTPLVKYVLVG